METYSYTVDGLKYELYIDEDHRITLALTGGQSPVFSPAYDPFDWDYRPALTDDLGNSRFPVTVLRHAYRYIEDWMRRERPGYFYFSALTEKRKSVYRRVAAVMTRRFPYHWAKQGGRFHFYRLKREQG
ncbi:MAG: hypothetical protein P1U64_11795 [Alcanivoracaceae bacterium]|nr:hypothetical protein [Alcanivoracaceae bacterium]